MSETHVAHTKPLSRMQSLSDSRGGSKVTKLIFSTSAKRYQSFSGEFVSQNAARSVVFVFREKSAFSIWNPFLSSFFWPRISDITKEVGSYNKVCPFQWTGFICLALDRVSQLRFSTRFPCMHGSRYFGPLLTSRSYFDSKRIVF